MNRGDRLANLITDVGPFGAWTGCDERDEWALVTEAGDDDPVTLRWVRTFPTREAMDEYVRHELRGDEHAVRAVNLEDGTAYLPALVWLVHRCSWPTCERMPAPDGRMFLGGRLCSVHTDESRERDAAALDEIAQAWDRC